MKEEIIIDKVIKKAIKEFKEEEKEEKKKRVLHNTELLLKNFNSLKIHSDKSRYDLSGFDIEEDDEDDRAYILSIRRSKLRTLIMVSHIEMAMNELKENKIREGSYEQYIALEMYYIEKKSYGDIRDELNCGQNTPTRWINSCIKELSILLFGLDGVKFDLV
ncbi:hypothetical protein [Clostridium perfringens]|uniref:hypothetical protein n=1 Tax=Clostridium perfringens TaxID=1502 RepID=UPI0024BC2B3A|nr:hypothetical protein [Clostridium perfringens]